MAKQTKVRLDAKGLTGLGLDKLVEILLEESIANKALKARLETALAGAAGPEEIARVIDRRLDALEGAKTAINRARARDFTVELAGLSRNIQSELAATDSRAAVERLLRLIGLRGNVERRLKAESARLMNVFTDAEAAVVQLMPALPDAEQAQLVPTLDSLRKRDRYGERIDFFAGVLGTLSKVAATAWQDLLEKQLGAVDAGPAVPRLLQGLFLANGDLDGYVSIEMSKPENRRDSYGVARLLFEAGRHAEALEWIRQVVAGLRVLPVNGTIVGVGPDYQFQERKLLEADILDALKKRPEAQAIRWDAFLDTFDADVLRRYISRLDDFAEFDELDRAFAAVRASERIHDALAFLVEWPKFDQAAAHVMAHARNWDGAEDDVLVPAADALADHYPVAATVLYRALLTHILDRAIVGAYGYAAHCMRTLASLSLRLPDAAPFEDHAAFVSGLMNRHARKYSFWQQVSGA